MKQQPIGPAIKELRRCLGLSQLYFALDIPVSQSTLSRWETGLANPSIGKLGYFMVLARDRVGREDLFRTFVEATQVKLRRHAAKQAAREKMTCQAQS
jgi:transcriptional regulator with XRE-family HTH domain